MKFQISNFNIISQNLGKSAKSVKVTINLIKNDYKKNYNNFIVKNNEIILLLLSKIKSFETAQQMQLKNIENKYEKHLTEQLRLNNKLERENKELLEIKNDKNLKSRDLTFKINELENELKNYKKQNERLQNEIESKTQEYEKLIAKDKLLIKNFSNNINNLLLLLNKLKKKYQGNIFSLKTQIETIKQLYINDAIYGNNNKNKTYSLQKENISMKNELEELKLKMEKLNEENDNYKKNNKLLGQQILLKDKNNLNLQEYFNKLLLGYNTTVKNIQVAQKIDGNIQTIIDKANVQINKFNNIQKNLK